MKLKTEFHPLVSASRSADCQSAVSGIGNPPDWQGISASPNSIRRHGRLTICVTLALASVMPSPLFACAACYGKSDSALAEGMNWGIFTLMGVILTVLTCILVFFVHIIRKEEKAANDSAPANPPRL
ncbi:MAG: hypothetical protein ACLPRE_06295 [Limisphaerales bacterium]